jgi:hypothetical protein
MTKTLVKKVFPEKHNWSFTFRIRPTLKQALVEVAADDRRSVAGIVEILLEEALKARAHST